jgi:pyridinium-3,5-bisthiocarboxylic acid mononucleotide nickel chelatase
VCSSDLIEAAHVERNGITAVKIDVIVPEGGHQHRHLKQITGLIDGSTLSDRVKKNATAIFLEVAKAESAVHGISMEKVHFHEVGALDSIVDIVGTAIGLEQLGISEVYSSPVRLGSGGFVSTRHGQLPLPGPAATEILKGYPVVLTEIPFELTTPTGAAIIRALSSGMLPETSMEVRSIGYGAGTRELPGIPNILRLMIGDLKEDTAKDSVICVETNIDDMNPEIYPYVIEKLLAAGALDAYCIPVVMKKGRPGILLGVLVERSTCDRIIGLILSETTTIGVRYYPAERVILGRTQREVATTFGVVRVKVITAGGRERFVPEYEECRRIAEGTGLPLITVYEKLGRELG